MDCYCLVAKRKKKSGGSFTALSAWTNDVTESSKMAGKIDRTFARERPVWSDRRRREPRQRLEVQQECLHVARCVQTSLMVCVQLPNVSQKSINARRGSHSNFARGWIRNPVSQLLSEVSSPSVCHPSSPNFIFRESSHFFDFFFLPFRHSKLQDLLTHSFSGQKPHKNRASNNDYYNGCNYFLLDAKTNS